MKEEHILVVPRSALEPFIHFRGFQNACDSRIEGWIEAGGFKPRPAMENDPRFKQLIPYILLRCGRQVYRYWRTRKAGESRLHHLYSLGIGGHIDWRDENLFVSSIDLLHAAALRELNEEVELAEMPELRHIGFINDDESEVGQVHLGIVYEAWLSSTDVKIRESALGRGEWISVDRLRDVPYETWSQFLVAEYLSKE